MIAAKVILLPFTFCVDFGHRKSPSVMLTEGDGFG